MELKGYQRKYLSSEAHHLDPVVMVGSAGMSEGVVKATADALRAHELIKVKFVDCKDDRKAIAAELARLCRAELVRVIGNIAILFLENPDADARRVRIPRRPGDR